MKLTVKLEDHTFEVEVGDIHARPILATIDGDTFEIWPDETSNPARMPQSAPQHAPQTAVAGVATATAAAATAAKTVLAPLPGTIVAVSVKPGAEVIYGQELCIIDAMKMKNVIRASRAGTIAVVNVTVSQSVKHHDVLMEFVD